MSKNIFINGKWDNYCPRCNELQNECRCINPTSNKEVVDIKTKDKTK